MQQSNIVAVTECFRLAADAVRRFFARSHQPNKQNADVILAVGLPFSRFGQEKKEFRDYLYRKGEICFCYSGNDYRIRIKDWIMVGVNIKAGQ